MPVIASAACAQQCQTGMQIIIESFRSEKTFKIKSNRKPDTSKFTTKPCP